MKDGWFLRFAIIFALWCGLASVAMAGTPVAEATKVLEQDKVGRWKAVKVTQQIVVGPEEQDPRPLEKGMELEAGAVLRARLAKAELELTSGFTLTLSPGAELVVKEPGLIEQLMGSILYKGKGLFSVSFGEVSCVVEGTEFEVVGPSALDGEDAKTADGSIFVNVTKGKVRVTTPSGELLVKKNTRVQISADGTLGEPEAWEYCPLCGFRHVPH